MKTQIECPHCSQQYVVGGNAAGKQVRCKACQQTFVVPELATEPEQTPVPMAELIVEPARAPRPAPPASSPLSAMPLSPTRPAPDLSLGRSPRRKSSDPDRKRRLNPVDEMALGLGVAFCLILLVFFTPPIGPATWALHIVVTGTGLVVWSVVTLRRGSLGGAAVVGGTCLIVMGIFVFHSGVLGNDPESLHAERAEEMTEEDELGSVFGDLMPDESDFLPHRPPVSSRGKETVLLGGTGGSPFRSVSPSGDPVVGISHSLGSWGGESAISQLEPRFVRGASGGFVRDAMAREGYAVGDLEIDAGKYVNAVRPVFMRIKPDGSLDPDDSYRGEWIGSPTGKTVRTVNRSGKKVIGICGRRAAVLDSVGLVVE